MALRKQEISHQPHPLTLAESTRGVETASCKSFLRWKPDGKCSALPIVEHIDALKSKDFENQEVLICLNLNVYCCTVVYITVQSAHCRSETSSDPVRARTLISPPGASRNRLLMSSRRSMRRKHHEASCSRKKRKLHYLAHALTPAVVLAIRRTGASKSTLPTTFQEMISRNDSPARR